MSHHDYHFLEITEIQAPPAQKGQAIALAMRIKNISDTFEDSLLNVRAYDVAGLVQLHDMPPMDGGGGHEHGAHHPSGMVPIREIQVRPGRTTSLYPAETGLHIMLIDLTKDLKQGDKFEVELEFALHGWTKLTAEVKPFS